MDSSAKFDLVKKYVKPIAGILAKAADGLIESGISKRPIFLWRDLPIPFGIPLVETRTTEGDLYVHISYEEELVQKGVIQTEKLSSFQSVYKPASQFICIFVLEEPEASFVFIPREL